MGFTAYTHQTVVQQLGRTVLSLCPWEDRLLVGLADGSLLVLQQQPAADEGATSSSRPWQVVQVHKAFGRKGVLQLLVVDDGQLLLSLSGEYACGLEPL
jgi:hypothetical protein